MLLAARGSEAPQLRDRRARRIPRAVQPRERNERPIDRVPGHRVVRPEVVLGLGLREHDRTDDAGLGELALELLGRDGSTTQAGVVGVGLEPAVAIHDAEVVLQLEHDGAVFPPGIWRYRSDRARRRPRNSPAAFI